MKCCIAYASTHHGNTKKVVDAIAKEFDVDVIDVTATHEKDLSEYDLIGFASGIYAAQFHQQVKNFAQVNLPQNKKIFYIMTSAMNKDFSKSMADSVKGKNAEIVGKFTCHGYNTFGPFKLVGGTSKTDLKKRSRVDVVNKYGEKLKVLFSGDYKAFDYGDPQSATELIVCGLGLGYPLESTAYILSR